jgi:hypothetical protein
MTWQQYGKERRKGSIRNFDIHFFHSLMAYSIFLKLLLLPGIYFFLGPHLLRNSQGN